MTVQYSIVIPTYKRNDLLELCLQRLQPGAQSLEANLYEVIVTDDAADAATEQLLLTQFPWATYTAGPQKGPAANRNHGASLATGQWLVFTDDDCLPDAHWLQAYSEAIAAHPSCRAFEGAILPDDWALLKKDMAECPVNTEGGCFWSANIMVQKNLFWKVGGFDENFRIAAQEDQDLCLRISKHTDIRFVQQSFIIHPVRLATYHVSKEFVLVRIANYSYFLEKHFAELGFNSYKAGIWENGVLSQLRSLVVELKLLHLKRAKMATFFLLLYFKHYLGVRITKKNHHVN